MVTMLLSTPPASDELSNAAAAPEDMRALAIEHRNDMVVKHTALVRYVAGSMARRSGSSSIVDYDDLVSYGTEGLIAAVETFDPSFDVKFSTWAVMHIRTTIQDALRTLDPLPRSLRTKGKAIERASYDLANRNGCWPQDKEVAEELGVPLPKLRTTMQDISKVVVSLNKVDEGHGEDSGYSWLSSLADDDPETDPEMALDNAETGVMLREAVCGLPERERRVVEAYYQQGLSMRTIADELGVSESRISQLHARSLKLLKTAITEALSDTVSIRSVA